MQDGTKDVIMRVGSVNGVRMRLIDTPGLHAAASCITSNRSKLHKVRDTRLLAYLASVMIESWGRCLAVGAWGVNAPSP